MNNEARKAEITDWAKRCHGFVGRERLGIFRVAFDQREDCEAFVNGLSFQWRLWASYGTTGTVVEVATYDTPEVDELRHIAEACDDLTDALFYYEEEWGYREPASHKTREVVSTFQLAVRALKRYEGEDV